MIRVPTLRPSLKLTSALLVLVQFAGLAHLSLARHGVCWEHGVVVELDGAQATGAQREPSAVPGVDATPERLARGDGHPHCPALWLHRQIRPTPAPAWVLAPPPVVGRPEVREGVPPARWAVLHRAPKQSPPA